MGDNETKPYLPETSKEDSEEEDAVFDAKNRKLAERGDESAPPAETPKATRYDLFSFETDAEGVLHVEQHGDDALQRIFGSESPALNHGLFTQCFIGLTNQECLDGGEDRRGFMPAIVRELAPRDAIEQMLAVQMATTHVALVRQGKRMANADQLPQFEAHERAYNKLARTYTTQMEALRKHRNGGKQTVTVQHVNVGDGGQAIVGNVETGGRGKNEK
jgi:hypothetical protein